MNEPASFTVRTGSRLHLGLWAWGTEHARQFGGVGMMIEHPEVAVRFAQAEQFTVEGPVGERVRQVAMRCAEYWGWPALPPCKVAVATLPRLHSGLGVGTQLALATALGLARVQSGSTPAGSELSIAAGRGVRSSVGTHGFDVGGLLVDAGKRPDEPLGRLEERVELPADWRVVLCLATAGEGLAGEPEQVAFARLPAIPLEVTHTLQRLAREELVPAANQGDFARFSEAVFAYGQQAGLCFASLQGGPYSSPAIAALVQALRERGVAGVGQSSWGPTVFAMVPSQGAGEELRDWLKQTYGSERYEFLLTRPRHRGATVEVDG